MALGRPPVPLTLTDGEREELERQKTAQALVLRARIVLLAGAGKRNSQIAAGPTPAPLHLDVPSRTKR